MKRFAGKGLRGTPFREYCSSSPQPNLIGMGMDPHAVVKTRHQAETYGGNAAPEYLFTWHHLLVAKDRSHGIELVQIRHGYPVIQFYRRACLVNHLIGERNIRNLEKNSGSYRKQTNWDALYSYVRLLEKEEMNACSMDVRRQRLLPFEAEEKEAGPDLEFPTPKRNRGDLITEPRAERPQVPSRLIAALTFYNRVETVGATTVA